MRKFSLHHSHKSCLVLRIKQLNLSKMKNNILQACLQGNSGDSLLVGEFGSTPYGVFEAEGVKS